MTSKSLSIYCSALALLFALGCSGAPGDTPDLGKVYGTVTVDGNAVEGVVVMFSPSEGGRPSSGTTDAQGKYELVYSTSSMGAKVGPHKVSISENLEIDDAALEENPDLMTNPPEGNIPQEYLEIQKDAEVKAGSNEINLEFP